jgi:hypothetical protein
MAAPSRSGRPAACNGQVHRHLLRCPARDDKGTILVGRFNPLLLAERAPPRSRTASFKGFSAKRPVCLLVVLGRSSVRRPYDSLGSRLFDVPFAHQVQSPCGSASGWKTEVSLSRGPGSTRAALKRDLVGRAAGSGSLSPCA